MPIFLDRHEMVDASAEEVARHHLEDLALQDEYGVKFITYWYDAERRTTFCLVDAPDKETADRVHAEAHGHIANKMVPVDLTAVEAFLGRVSDPPLAPDEPLDDSAFRAIMFTDMVGSTEMTSRLGDRKAVEILRAHDAIVRRSLEQHRGSEVKHTGDGIMASFGHVPDSVDCALDIHERLAAYNLGAETPIRVRIGIHAGDPVEEGDDLFGSAVQLAARICDRAETDAVLVSADVRDACPDRSFEPAGSATLKGIAEPVPLFVPE